MVKFVTIEIPDTVAPAWIVLTNANEGGSELLSVVEGDFLAVFPEQSAEERRLQIANAAASLCLAGLCIVYNSPTLTDKSDAELADLEIPHSSIAGLAVDPVGWAHATIATTDEGRAAWIGGPEVLMRKLGPAAA